MQLSYNIPQSAVNCRITLKCTHFLHTLRTENRKSFFNSIIHKMKISFSNSADNPNNQIHPTDISLARVEWRGTRCAASHILPRRTRV